ncbi:jacalin-related lectin 3-like, partial [Cornus florida]|uniref:jacalin-related lectin 3-like n=1 Tax=Cornus florida TaxID=4283 RepID=UPI0028989CDE
KFNNPSEYLLSIWGYCSSDSALECVQSLTIETNKKTYGPFGTEKGKYFKFPLTSAKIVGFHGRSGIYLDCFGAHLEPISDPSQSISVGPFGGQRGDQWDDGKYSTVRQLIISYGSVIDSVQIEYDDNGKSKRSVKHGKSESGTKIKVQLDYPNEYLISISGYLTEDSNKAVIRSLTIQSNKKKYGPYGVEKGKQFATPPSTKGKIVGFHGRSGLYLDSIGAYFEPFPDTHQPMILGPVGGYGGTQWDDGIYTTVRQIIIYAGVVVDSIQIEYDKNGRSILSNKHGQSTGGTKRTVKFDYPNEFLVAISGYYSLESAFFGIQSITFHSNRTAYGPFGTESGKHFMFSTPLTGKIVGLYGRSGYYLDAIGAYFLSPPSLVSVGPFGGPGGDEWDDGKYSGVKQVIIYSDGLVFVSIQIEYDDNGKSKWSEKHGNLQRGTKHTITVDYPDEYLLSISGHYSMIYNLLVVRSLEIKSNKKTYGPFGNRQGQSFDSSSSQTTGKIVGFHGRSGDFVDAIGVHVQPFAGASNI